MLGITKTRKSLNDILSTFNKAIEDLAALQNGNGDEIAENSETIVELQEKNRALVSESETAAKVQKRLSDIIQ